MTNTDHQALMDHDDPALSASSVEGYVVDIACLRRWPAAEFEQRARQHTIDCSLMGHCVESGYALIDEGGRPHLLDSHATPMVLRCLDEVDATEGIYLRAEREEREGEMVTTDIISVGGSSAGAGRTGDGA